MPVDASEVTGAIDGLREYLRDARVEAAEMALVAMRESFDRQQDPSTGSPWPPAAPSTLEAKGGAGRLLVATGQLRASLERGAPGNVFRVGRTAVMVGTADRAAGFAQHGTKPHEILPRRASVLAWPPGNFARRVSHPGTPPRRIVGVSRATARLIERAMKHGSEESMKRGKK